MKVQLKPTQHHENFKAAHPLIVVVSQLPLGLLLLEKLFGSRSDGLQYVLVWFDHAKLSSL
jgi:hypothetical protein